MNPVIFVGLIAAMLAATGNARQRPQAPIPSGAVVAVLIWFIVGPLLAVELALLIAALRRGDLAEAALASATLGATTLVLFPWPITRALLIPGGRPKLAWLLTRLSFWTWRRDVRGGAVVAACWAALRRAQRGAPLDEALLAWIDRRLSAAPAGAARWKLGGAGIVAAGLLAEARGDRLGARRLLASAGELAEPTRSRASIALAWSWLCADAAERGAWRELEFLARTAPIETATTKLFGGVAARLTGIAPIPNDLVLQSQWAMAPARVALWPLLQRALAAPLAAARTQDAPARRPAPELPEGQPLLAAMMLHAHVLSADPAALTRDDIREVAKTWDRALADPELERALISRGVALGAHEDAADPAALAELVRGDLLALIRAAGLELGELGESSELLGHAARRLHGELLDDLEMAATALDSRVDVKRELPAIDEWQAFLGLREQYAEAVALGGLRLRRLAFGNVHGPVCALAVWLWNERSERAIANAMFQWLLAEAVIVDDAEAIRLQERNVDCGV